MPGFRRQEAGLTATAWSLCWGGICCVCSLLPAPPPILAGGAARQTDSLPVLGQMCVGCPICSLSGLSSPCSLDAPLPRPLGGMSCPGRHCITALGPDALGGCSCSDQERAEVWVSGLLWGICRLSHVALSQGWRCHLAPLHALPVKALTWSAWNKVLHSLSATPGED